MIHLHDLLNVFQWELPNRQQIAELAETASRFLTSLAIIFEITSRVLRAVSRELAQSAKRNRIRL